LSEANVPPHYVDAGMDDEMIETSHADATTDEFPAPSDEASSASSPFSQAVAEDRGHAIESYEAEPTYQSPSYEEPRSDTEYSEQYNEPVDQGYEAPRDETSEEVTSEYAVRAFDSYAHDAEPVATGESSSNETVQTATPDTASGQYFDQFSKTEKMPGPNTIMTALSSLGLDEGDLLDLPPLASGQNVEITTNEASNTKQIVSLSPELMEAIVQKVVEKISKEPS
jgi:hypothetical protein